MVTNPSLFNQNFYKHQTAFVYAPDGKTFIDVLRDAPLLAGFKETINSGMSPLRVQLPRSFDLYDQSGVINSRGTIAQGNVIKYYIFGPTLPPNGQLRYQGYIDTVEPEINDKGEESVTITIVPFSSVLGDHGIAKDIEFGVANSASTYKDPLFILKWFFDNTDPFTNQRYMAPLTWDPANPTSSGNKGHMRFSNQTMGSIFDNTLLMLPANWYYRVNADNTVSVNVPHTFADHTLYVGRNISNPQYRMDWSNLRNVVVVQGSTKGGKTTGTASGHTKNASIKNGKANGSTSGHITSGSFNGSGSGSGSGSSSGSGSISGSVTVNSVPSTNSFGGSANVSGSANVNVNVNVSGGISGQTAGTFNGSISGEPDADVDSDVVITSVPMQVVKTGDSLNTFGERVVYQNYSNVTDENTLNILALGLLQQLNRYTIRTRVRIPDLSGIHSMGYPIDSMKVGQTVLVVDPTAPNSSMPTLWDKSTWDQDTWDFRIGVNLKTSLFDHVLPIVSIDYGYDYIDIELDSLLPNLSRNIYLIQQRFGDYTMGSIRTASGGGASLPTIQV